MRTILILLFSFLPTLALAHGGHGADLGETAGALHGFAHPFGGIDHILAMVGVGALGYVLGGRARWLLPLGFLSVMTLGFLAAGPAAGLPYVELGIGLSSLMIGGAMALGRPLPAMVALGLCSAFAVFHGFAHGTEMPSGTPAPFYLAGFLGATLLLHLSGMAAMAALVRLAGRHGTLLARSAGGLFALGGLGVLAGWL